MCRRISNGLYFVPSNRIFGKRHNSRFKLPRVLKHVHYFPLQVYSVDVHSSMVSLIKDRELVLLAEYSRLYVAYCRRNHKSSSVTKYIVFAIDKHKVLK